MMDINNALNFISICGILGIAIGLLFNWIYIIRAVRKNEKEKKVQEDYIKRGMKSYYENPDDW